MTNPVLDLKAHADHFWRFVERRGADECWRWLGGTSGKYGYGKFAPTHDSQFQAHRFAYELTKAPIPMGLQIDHLCGHPWCVNPAHLEAVTARENTMRSQAITAQNARKIHCRKGHPYSPDNTQWIKTPNGRGRQCRECNRLRCQRTRAKRAAVLAKATEGQP